MVVPARQKSQRETIASQLLRGREFREEVMRRWLV
jgi:hypothetical protein